MLETIVITVIVTAFLVCAIYCSFRLIAFRDIQRQEFNELVEGYAKLDNVQLLKTRNYLGTELARECTRGREDHLAAINMVMNNRKRISEESAPQ